MQRCFTLTQCQSVSTFESEVRNSLSALEPHSMDSLGHQHCAKKLSPKIALHFKVLCESKATLLQGNFNAMKVCYVHLSINWKILLHSLSSRMKLGIRFCSQVIFMGIIGIKLPKKAYYLGQTSRALLKQGYHEPPFSHSAIHLSNYVNDIGRICTTLLKCFTTNVVSKKKP